MTINTYQQALDYIYSFINHSLTRNLRYSEDKFDLTRMYELMSLLGNPQLDYDVVHVAGTKGKGSTCAMIASILESQGLKVGFYSSPHMIDFNERIRINSSLISNSEIVEIINSIKNNIEKVPKISTFEIITAAAFEYFSQKKVDIAVIEVGMGGRLDATNVVSPKISVITPISLDHTKILGNTIPGIAKEKAGIIKKGIPVVIGKQVPEAYCVIKTIAEKKSKHIIDVESLYKWEQIDYSLSKQSIHVFRKVGGFSSILEFSLLGDHQAENAITALATINNLENYEISQSAIKNGFRAVKWPGRFEAIQESPLVIIDGAHNPDSFKKLSQTIKKYLPNREKTLIFGASEDKNVEKMIDIISPFVDRIMFTKSSHPRAMSKEEIFEKISLHQNNRIKFLDIEKIVGFIKDTGNADNVYIFSGSIFVAGAVKEMLENE